MFHISKTNRITALLLGLSGFFLSACQTVDLYEKNVSIPAHEWKSSFKPQFRFLIKDTAAYELYIVIRHNEKYAYNNIWLNLSTQFPGDTTIRTVPYELPLANNEGWIGKETAMDDLYEHRILITPANQPIIFPRPGEYIFTIAQIMREDPLRHVLNVGLRIEKKQARRTE
jgi:gliding motility-associated lipoprotein GldH